MTEARFALIATISLAGVVALALATVTINGQKANASEEVSTVVAQFSAFRCAAVDAEHSEFSPADTSQCIAACREKQTACNLSCSGALMEACFRDCETAYRKCVNRC